MVGRDDSTKAPTTYGRVISDMTLEIALRSILLLALPVTVGIVALAIRNLRLKRGDRRGAFRIAVFGALTGYVALKIGIHFPSSLYDLVDFWIVTDAQPIQWACIGWLYYIALEPEVRRTWPHTLISWSRLLSGRLRDPLVGRDVLVGVTAGLTWTCLWLGGVVIPDPIPLLTREFVSPPAPPLALAIPALASNRAALSVLLQYLYPSVLFGRLLAAGCAGRLSAHTQPAGGAVPALACPVPRRHEPVGRPKRRDHASSRGGADRRCRLPVRPVVDCHHGLHLRDTDLPAVDDRPDRLVRRRLGAGPCVAVGLGVYGFLVSLAGKPLFGRSVLQA